MMASLPCFMFFLILISSSGRFCFLIILTIFSAKKKLKRGLSPYMVSLRFRVFGEFSEIYVQRFKLQKVHISENWLAYQVHKS